MDEPVKISANKQKKIEIVSGLNEKIKGSKAIVFTNYQGLKHKQIEGLKKEIKPLKAEFVVAKNSLVLRALDENKIKVDENEFQGPTGTLLINDDIVGPLKALAKLIKELGIPNIKFGIMDGDTLTGEQVLKISSLPTKEILLTQVVISLKSPISGLHRALNWNLQKLVMTLGAVAKAKPADAPPAQAKASEPAVDASANQAPVSEPEPETILDETIKEEIQEQPNPIAAPVDNPGNIEEPAQPTENNSNEEKSEGGEN